MPLGRVEREPVACVKDPLTDMAPPPPRNARRWCENAVRKKRVRATRAECSAGYRRGSTDPRVARHAGRAGGATTRLRQRAKSRGSRPLAPVGLASVRAHHRCSARRVSGSAHAARRNGSAHTARPSPKGAKTRMRARAGVGGGQLWQAARGESEGGCGRPLNFCFRRPGQASCVGPLSGG